MTNRTADLHIHSYFSDGTMSPEEILEEALKNNVGLLAITDHDNLEGTAELQKLCQDKDIIYLTGVELDSLEEGANIHVLGYGVDLQNKAFQSFVKQNRLYLETVNATLIEKLQEDVEAVSMEDYKAYSYDRRKGGWKALHYVMEKGLTNSLREGFALYTKYHCTYAVVDFPSIKAVCEQIHKACGKAILAHPGVSIREQDMSLFKKQLLQLIDYGLDGLECYYVTHTGEITQTCLTACKERNLLITAGSDCHGAFGKAHIGDVNIPISMINLGDLLL